MDPLYNGPVTHNFRPFPQPFLQEITTSVEPLQAPLYEIPLRDGPAPMIVMVWKSGDLGGGFHALPSAGIRER